MAAAESANIVLEVAESAESPTGENSHSSSLLNSLNQAQKSELSRKRKVEQPKGSGEKRKSKTPTDPSKISPKDRIKEFPNEYLEVRHDKLFCLACRKELSLKKSTINNHVYSNTHKNSKEALVRKEAREGDISNYLKKYDKEEQPAGTSLSMAERVYRVRVVENFLRAGIPLSKVDSLRGLLEEDGMKLTHSSHLADCIPLLLKQEKEKLRAELEETFVSDIFDGTTRSGEVLAIVLRFVKEGNIEQRLVRLVLLAKSVNGDELAREVLTTLSTELGVTGSKLLACIRDGASVNTKAMATLRIMYPQVMNIVCLSHAPRFGWVTVFDIQLR